jgi:hypothetical protein
MWHAKTFATDQTRAEDSKARAIYEEELNRVWPNDGNQRERKIARFAEDNGFRLRFYRDGLCAIFDREPREGSENSHQTLLDP